ncbi:MAG: alpha/beta hydrolase [Chloroflexota bacterium]
MPNENKNQINRLKYMGWIAGGIVVLLGMALSASTFYQQAASQRDRSTYVSADHIIDMNGIEMHFRCEGEGSPTVVLESGAGTPYLNWWEIQADLVQDVRTCVYDRQGLGWSEYTGQIPTPTYVAQTLHTLLERAGESEPYVLVGHSMGGIYVREFAVRYPDEVVGMVLVDSSHEQQLARLPEAYVALAETEPTILALCRRLAPTGVLRILNIGSQDPTFSEDTPVYHENIAMFNQSQFCAGVSTDLAGVHSLDTSAPPHSLGDLPLVVLSAGVLSSNNPDLTDVGLSTDALQEVDRTWLALQAELAALSTNSKWTVVDGATHYIHFDQPQVVIDAIRDVIGKVHGD